MDIAICIIAYNRLDSLKRVLASLEKGYYDSSVTLIVSIDKSDTTIVEDYAKQYNWKFGEKRVVTHSLNLGLRKHVLQCGDLLNEYDALIVLEDDISVAPSFYYYAKQCVEKFFDDPKIAGISLYNFPLNYHNNLPFNPLHSDSDVYFMQCAQSWGQVWMKKQWFAFKEWYLKNSEEFGEQAHLPKSICKWPKSSWLKYHTRYVIENNKYFVYPYISLSTNNGDIGTHYGKSTTLFQSKLLYGKKRLFKLDPVISYDGFFENEMLYEVFGYDRQSLCVDFYGQKDNALKRRFWLTRKKKPYKIVKAFPLALKPYEWNILNNEEGKELFLYDTEECVHNRFKSLDRKYFLYLYNLDLVGFRQIRRQIILFLKRFPL